MLLISAVLGSLGRPLLLQSRITPSANPVKRNDASSRDLSAGTQTMYIIGWDKKMEGKQ